MAADTTNFFFLGVVVIGVILSLMLYNRKANSAGSEFDNIGSKDDLLAQVEAMGFPSSWTFLGEYFHYPPPKWGRRRTGLVRWFSFTGTVEEARSDIVSCFQRAGMKYRVVTVKDIIHGNDEIYIFFVTLDQGLIANNPKAPPGTRVEVSAKVLRGIRVR